MYVTLTESVYAREQHAIFMINTPGSSTWLSGHRHVRRRAMVDQDQVLANIDSELDRCRWMLSQDTYDLIKVFKLMERVDELLDQRSALTLRSDEHA
jgi:hypothetical protein